MIKAPPKKPVFTSLSQDVQLYLDNIDRYLHDLYTNFRLVQTGQVNITTSDAAPAVGIGNDGDVHIRVDGANTAIYLNINGVWSAYNNP